MHADPRFVIVQNQSVVGEMRRRDERPKRADIDKMECDKRFGIRTARAASESAIGEAADTRFSILRSRCKSQ
jgi:hypothetical protein